MKKLTLIIISLFAIILANSQPVLTSSLNPQIGDKYAVDYYSDVPSLDPGPSGANVTWNFSVVGGTHHTGEFYIVVDPLTTPFKDSACVATANICVHPESLSQGGVFEYVKCNSNNIQALAVASTDPSGVAVSFIKYLNPQIGMQYPFTYGDNFNDTHEGIMLLTAMGFYYWRDSSYVTVEADAWGSITTPVATYNNVLRIKKTTQSYTYTRYAANAPWMFIGMFETINYDWFDPSIGINVFGIHKDIDMPTYDGVDVLTYYNQPVGITDNYLYDNIDIMPNPANDFIQLKNCDQKNILEYTLYDVSGNVVMNSAFYNQKINVSGLRSGLYILELKSSNTSIRKKLVIQ